MRTEGVTCVPGGSCGFVGPLAYDKPRHIRPGSFRDRGPAGMAPEAAYPNSPRKEPTSR